MKQIAFFLFATFFLSIITFAVSCNFEMHEAPELDNELIGIWVLYDDANQLQASWEFLDDGRCVEFRNKEYHNWFWEIEECKLKCYEEGGTSDYMTYSIDGKYLYFYMEEEGVWSLPYVKDE